MRRVTVLSILAGVVLTLVIGAGVLALDRTVLHWYAESTEPTTSEVLTEAAAPTPRSLPPTEPPVPTKLPDRNDCDAMRGTDYRSPTEREWFLANCVTPEPVQVRPPVGPVEPVIPPPQQPPVIPPPQQPPVQEAGTLMAADGQFLGVVTCNRFDPDGIFNRFGSYGSRFSSTSIWNRFGEYGGRFGQYSPFNRFAKPPTITNGSVAYLTMKAPYLPRVTPLDLVLGCFGSDPSTLDFWLGLIEDSS